MASAPAAPAVDGTPAQILYKIMPVFMPEQCVQRSPEFCHVMTWRSANGFTPLNPDQAPKASSETRTNPQKPRQS
eukprot:4205459-Pleurochrysis_carterae.AAC.1